MQLTHCSVLVLISGNGSNLQAIIDDSIHSNYKVCRVICNKADAYGLTRAAQAGIPSTVIDHRDYGSREDFDSALIDLIDQEQVDLIVLAGFMRILSPKFVKHYAGKVLNIHPSLLPAYTGTDTHQRVLDAGEKEHGVSVHFVTEELDGGPVIAQEKISVEKNDTADTLADKVHIKEHIIYPKVISWFAAGRIKMESNKAVMDHEPLPATGIEVHPN
ncbi:MAG: phosphoribosylglycinamide formyltransferase [Gammaproteobacteria bacterium]|jgi:phosphoribosylglycinamide formyltransferase-1|nr:phosphoribosylglycinamide formyltransferase [Gammaproteobacteria bacterium]MBT3860375.1 phosphoribosylglycinamide formyltransferase [Gammaproteobacteria bacterium]MBT3985990.1 phosphoribosylglycinamide formyltransferase [Gammaproteobacteria bacterium]MBT4582352.1 phosphoribosylglycinamide formyltransferase [Gammaproteobacteria bacterium]MBT4658914.1 phosphoribosylglycinamide formyltransferase [Gammaproteobacteria bacterium]